jgi:hypothetical protein
MLRRFLFLAIVWSLVSVFSTSCEPDCTCGPVGSYRVYTQGLDLIAYQTQGFDIKPVIDTAFHFAFGIQARFKQYSEQIALRTNSGSGFFGNAAYACDCPGPFYEVSDPVNDINLYLINPSQADTSLVNQKFMCFLYDGQELITLDSAIRFLRLNSEAYYYPNFSKITFELIEPSLFKGNRKIQCVTKLKSGKTFTAFTQDIYFK